VLSFGLKYALITTGSALGPPCHRHFDRRIDDAWSSWLLGRGYPYFSEGIVALVKRRSFSPFGGLPVLHAVLADVGFFGMILITAAMAAIRLAAIRTHRRPLLLAATQLPCSSARVRITKSLFTYLLILGGHVGMGERKDWYSSANLFIGTQLYFGWFEEFYHRTSSPPLERTTLFATLFFLLFATLPSFARIKEGVLAEMNPIATVNAFVMSAAVRALLAERPLAFTLLVLALAAGHIAVARVIPA